MPRISGADGTQGNRKKARVQSLLEWTEILPGFDEPKTGARREITGKLRLAAQRRPDDRGGDDGGEISVQDDGKTEGKGERKRSLFLYALKTKPDR